MTEKLQRLELTWPGKEDRFNPEPRILLEDKEKSYSKPVISSPLSSKECSSAISSPLRGEDKGEGEQPNLLSLAKKMRHNPTEAENKMWQILRNNQLGYKIRRQHQIGQYIVDFICLEKKLIIECDGGQHNETVDKERTLFLENEGFRVIRFWNNEILNNIEGCWEIIQKSLNDCTPHPNPLPQGARNSIVFETSPLRGEGDTLVSGEGDKLNLLKTKRIQPTFDNMLIHGDNLLALKALEQDYTGKIKCIYIDPPYNTGNAFEHYDDGLEHSIWLSLMRDRLEILRRLLSNDGGSIWISIDADESHYLKVLCDEIFGRQCFVDEVIWQRAFAPVNLKKTLSRSHDTILVYCKNPINFILNTLPRSDKQCENYKNPDNDPRGAWTSADCTVGPVVEEKLYEIITPGGRSVFPPEGRCWLFSKDRFEEMVADNRIWFGKNGNNAPRVKKFISEVKGGVVATTLWTRDECGDNQEAKREIKALFPDEKNPFDTPKPERLIQRILTLASNPGDLVLDSFLGSGTTAAVAQKMGRRWIGVEMGDHVYTHCIPRLKKVIDGEDQGGITKAVNWQGGGGFKFYELASSLIVTDKYGQQIISKEYNADMLAEAMCKILGYRYKPDKEIYWKQGFSSEKNFIYTTTMSLQESSLDRLAEEIGDNNLLICCSAFVGNSRIYPNISVKKIPAAILKKCEWGREGYPLNLRNYHPTDEEFEFEEKEE